MKKLISLSLTILLTACGGGGESDAGLTDKPSTTTISTRNLVAAKDFDFKINSKIAVTLSNSNTGKGAYTVYYKRAFTDPDSGLITADPMSRITSVRSSLQTDMDIMVNDSWNELLVTWVSETANIPEITKVIALEPETSSYNVSF